MRTSVKELHDEVRLALHVEADQRRAIARALERKVDLILVELQHDADSMVQLCLDLKDADYPPPVVAVYRAQEFGDDQLSERFVSLVRAGVQDFLARPLSLADLRGLLERVAPTGERAPSNVGRVVSFIGSKGGVGKSTLSVNTAVTLARSGSVLIVDASLQHGVAADLLDLEPRASLADAAREVDRLDASLLSSLTSQHSSGVDVLCAPANAIEAAAVVDTVLARAVSVARRAYDYVVIDTFPLLDSVTLAVLDLSDLVYVVLNNSLPTVNGTAGLLDVLDQLGIDPNRSRVVLNCTHPGRSLSPVDVATRLEREIDYVVPYSAQVLQAANTGKPPAQGIRRIGRWGRALKSLAEDAAQVDVGLKGPSTGGSQQELIQKPTPDVAELARQRTEEVAP